MIKSVYFTLFFLLLCSKLWAQDPPAWGGGADINDISFGFHFDYITSNYKIVKQPTWLQPYYYDQTGKYLTDSVKSITSPNATGFAVGFIARYRITDHLEVRTTPSLTFADRYVYFQYNTSTQDVTKSLHASLVEVPLLIKIKSDRLQNFRGYLIGGAKYSYGLSADKQNDDPSLSPLEKQILSKRGYASYEVGVGCDIYFEYFKLSPELKISNSFGNVLVPEAQPYSSPISKLFLHTLMINLYFE